VLPGIGMGPHATRLKKTTAEKRRDMWLRCGRWKERRKECCVARHWP
jgi:hypothetical protein